MEKVTKVSTFRLSSLLRLQKDPILALNLFQNPNPNPNPKIPIKTFKYSLLSYDLIITKLGRSKMFTEMDQIMHQLKLDTRIKPKEVIFCNIMAFYSRARLSDRVIKMFDQIEDFRCKRTVKSFNSLLNALLRCGEFDKLMKVFAGTDQFVPDVCTYNVVISSCCLSGCLDDALYLFDEMRQRGVSPNAVTFGTLINGLCVNSREDDAFRLKEDMVRVFHVKPNAYVYASLVKAVCGSNDLSLGFKLKDEMLEKGIVLDSAIFSTLISGLYRVGRKEEVSGVLKEMRDNGCKPTEVTYNAMISGLCKDKDFEGACGLLNEMVDDGCKHDVISYNIIIGGFCKEGKVKEARELFEDMPRRGCIPDVLSYRMLFDGFCEIMEFEDAAFVLDEMVFKGYVPLVGSVNKFVGRLCEDGNVELLVKILISLGKGKVIDLETWRVVVSSLSKRDEMSGVVEIVDSLLRIA